PSISRKKEEAKKKPSAPAPKKAPAPAARAPAGKAPAAGGKAPAPASKQVEGDDEYENPNPYEVTTLDLTPRCPHCATEFESEDAVICIGCGYNLETREHLKLVKTIENTGADQFLWLLPGVACILGIIFMILLDIFWIWFLPDLVEDDSFLWLLAT